MMRDRMRDALLRPLTVLYFSAIACGVCGLALGFLYCAVRVVRLAWK